MSNKKSKGSLKETEEHIIQIHPSDMTISLEKKPSKCCCCNRKYISLFVVGFALLAVGSLLILAHFSIKKITSSVALLQNTFPCYITGGLMAANGLLCIIMFKKRPKGLIILSVMATIAATLLCFAGTVFSLTNVAPILSSFEKCQYFPKEFSCRCFFTSDLRQVSYVFRGTKNCKVVQFELRNMIYGISGVYGAGLAFCLVVGIMECMLLSPNKKSKRLSCRSRYEGDGKTDSTSRQSQTSQTNLTLSCSEADIIAAANSDTAHASTSTASNNQTRRETQSRRESQSACARQHTCSHYVVDLDPVPRRDYIINYNSASSRHDPPPPYTE